MSSPLPFNFGGLAKEFSSYQKSSVAVLPIPFDKTSTWLKGADKGPQAIIEASRNMELYDIETSSEVYKRGIFTAKPIRASRSESMNEKVRAAAAGFIADEKFIVALGGEHSVSLGVVRALAESAKNISVLHLDAHTDMRESYDGNIYSHACVMKRIREITTKTISVGIRSMDSSELDSIDNETIFYAEDIYSSDDWIKKASGRLSQNVYITIDVDVFDTGIMPSTGTPEPGGLQWYQVLKLLKHVSENKNILGFDVVELRPSENKAPDFLAAKLVYKLLSYKFSNK